jgi:hypothetical protein
MCPRIRVAPVAPFISKETSMKINGRILRPTTLAERRLLLSMGVPFVRAARSMNPYVVARRLARLAKNECPDALLLRQLVERTKAKALVIPPAEVDTPEPVEAAPVMQHVAA